MKDLKLPFISTKMPWTLKDMKIIKQFLLCELHIPFPKIRNFVRTFSSEKFDAFKMDTHVKRNFDYLHKSERYANTTFRLDSLGPLSVPKLLHESLTGSNLLIIKSNNCQISSSSWVTMMHRLGFPLTEDDHDTIEKFENWISSVHSMRNVKSLNKTELQMLLYVLACKKIVISESNVESLGVECARRVSMWNAEACLLIADLWLTWIGYCVVHKVFFNVLMKEWHKVSNCQVSQHLIQLLFYVGLRKSTNANIMILAEKWLENELLSMTEEELVIVCQGFFKTSTKLSSQTFIANVAQRVIAMMRSAERQYKFMEHDMVSMLKVLRHAKLNDSCLFQELSTFLKHDEHWPSNLVACAHYIACFGNGKVYDKEIFSKCEEMTLQKINEDMEKSTLSSKTKEIGFVNKSCRIRLKDIARILWAMSSLGHDIVSSHFTEAITKHLQKQIKYIKHPKEHDQLLDCVLSLIIMGIFPRHLIQNTLSLYSSNKFNVSKKKIMHKLFFVHQSMKIEVSDYKEDFPLINTELRLEGMVPYTNISSELEHRPFLDMIKCIVHALCNGNGDLYRCDYLLSHITIAGLEIFLDANGNVCSGFEVSDKCYRVAIEVCDSSVCLQDQVAMNGMLKAKIRQLKKIGYTVILISLGTLNHVKDLMQHDRVNWFTTYLTQSLKTAEKKV